MDNTDTSACHGPRRSRAFSTSGALTRDEVRLVKGMLLRGDAQHRIAAWFDVNPGRIAEIATGERHTEVEAAPVTELPPNSPLLRPCDAAEALGALAAAEHALACARRLILRQ